MARIERNHDRPASTSTKDGPAATPRSGSAGFFRALVAAAVAAAAPAAGCYASDPGEDVGDAADTTDVRDVAVEVYGLPDGTSESAAVYSVPPYGAPEYGAPDYGVP